MSIIIYYSYHLKRLCSKYTKILTSFLYFFFLQIIGEFAKEAKNIQTEIDKLLQGLGNANAAPPAKPATPNPVNSNTSKNKRNR